MRKNRAKYIIVQIRKKSFQFCFIKWPIELKYFQKGKTKILNSKV